MGATNTAHLAIHKPHCNPSSSQHTELLEEGSRFKESSPSAIYLPNQPRSSWNISRWNSVLEEPGWILQRELINTCVSIFQNLSASKQLESQSNHNFETGDLLSSTSVNPEWVASILST